MIGNVTCCHHRLWPVTDNSWELHSIPMSYLYKPSADKYPVVNLFFFLFQALCMVWRGPYCSRLGFLGPIFTPGTFVSLNLRSHVSCVVKCWNALKSCFFFGLLILSISVRVRYSELFMSNYHYPQRLPVITEALCQLFCVLLFYNGMTENKMNCQEINGKLCCDISESQSL